mmetsp:Transcript_25324/g.54696  ORF Transcript_25324/g.54696 Transcript_25324/m.54696 type:complete len:203 (+) Transcript_25324:1154-1762(+)
MPKLSNRPIVHVGLVAVLLKTVVFRGMTMARSAATKDDDGVVGGYFANGGSRPDPELPPPPSCRATVSSLETGSVTVELLLIRPIVCVGVVILKTLKPLVCDVIFCGMTIAGSSSSSSDGVLRRSFATGESMPDPELSNFRRRAVSSSEVESREDVLGSSSIARGEGAIKSSLSSEPEMSRQLGFEMFFFSGPSSNRFRSTR